MVQRKKVQWSKVALSCDVTISSSSPQKTIIPFSKEIKNHHFLKQLIFSSRLFKPGKNRDICFFLKKNVYQIYNITDINQNPMS